MQEIRLSKLDLPSFSGERIDWPEVHNLFMSSVHNNTSLTGAQKLQYLKKSLTVEPSSKITPFDCTESNYNKAWKMLEFINYESKLA